MTTLSRRSFLAGAGILSLSSLACGGSGGELKLFDPSAANDLWITKVLGRVPAALLIKRIQGVVPTHNEDPFFRRWQISFNTRWPAPTQQATHTEIYEDRSGDMVAVFRGMPPADPTSPTWTDHGRTAAGARELYQSPHGENFRVFVLPDGTWVSGWGTAAARLAGRFASDVSPPPKLNPKPSAQLVQQIVVSPDSRMGFSSALYASDQIRGVTIATFAPGATEVPTSIDVIYSSANLAAASAADLTRVRAATRNTGDGVAEVFLRTATITNEDNALVLKSVLPSATVAAWTH